jgi:hypothetical protein
LARESGKQRRDGLSAKDIAAVPRDQQAGKHRQPEQAREMAQARERGEESCQRVPHRTPRTLGAVECPERGQTEDRNGDVVSVDACTIQQQDPGPCSAGRDAKRQHQCHRKGADAVVAGLPADNEDNDEQEKPARNGQCPHLDDADAEGLEDGRLRQRVDRHMRVVVALHAVIACEQIGTKDALRRQLVGGRCDPGLIFPDGRKDTESGHGDGQVREHAEEQRERRYGRCGCCGFQELVPVRQRWYNRPP